MDKEQIIHGYNIPALLAASILNDINNQEMTIRELRIMLCKFDRNISAIDAIAKINSGEIQ